MARNVLLLPPSTLALATRPRKDHRPRGLYDASTYRSLGLALETESKRLTFVVYDTTYLLNYPPRGSRYSIVLRRGSPPPLVHHFGAVRSNSAPSPHALSLSLSLTLTLSLSRTQHTLNRAKITYSITDKQGEAFFWRFSRFTNIFLAVKGWKGRGGGLGSVQMTESARTKSTSPDSRKDRVPSKKENLIDPLSNRTDR